MGRPARGGRRRPVDLPRHRRPSARPDRDPATAHVAAAFLLAVHVVGLLANLGASTWREASRLGPGSMLSLLVLSLPFAAIGWVLPSDRPDEGPAVHPARSVDVEPGDPVVWSGRARAHGAWIPLAVVAGVDVLLAHLATPPAT